MTAIDRSILTVVAAALILGAGFLLRAMWQRHMVARLRKTARGIGNGFVAPSLMYFRTKGCAPCRVQELAIRELHDALASMGQAIRITSHDAVAESALVRELRVVTVPTTVVLAGDGRVVAWNPGLVDARTLMQQVGPLLSMPAAEVPSRTSPMVPWPGGQGKSLPNSSRRFKFTRHA